MRAERLGERLHGVGVVAHLHQAIAHLEPGLRLFLGARVLLHHAPVGSDGVRMPAREVEGRGSHQRGGGSELRIRPALLQLGGRRPRLRVVAPVALRPRDLQLRHVGPGAVRRGRDLVEELSRIGVVVRYEGRDTLREETSEAYKDAAQVVRVCEGAGLSRPVAKLRPFLVVKG